MSYDIGRAGLAKFASALALLFIANPAQAANATVADFFPMCTALPANEGNKLVVDPGRKNGAYPDIASALRTAKPGDTIELMSGDYGALTLSGVNSGFISIAAARGQSPRFSKIAIGGSKPTSHWRLTGLTVSGMSAPSNGKWTHDKLILVLDSDNIVLDHNNITSKEVGMVCARRPGCASDRCAVRWDFSTPISLHHHR